MARLVRSEDEERLGVRAAMAAHLEEKLAAAEARRAGWTGEAWMADGLVEYFALPLRRLEAAEAIVFHAWQMPEPALREQRGFVRLEPDGTVTLFDEHPEIHRAARGRRWAGS